MKLIQWKLWLFASICFLFVGINYLINKNFSFGIMFICLGLAYMSLSIVFYRRNNKTNKIVVPQANLENIDIELKKLIADGRKIEAIKKYRMLAGIGLKEAKEYIDLLSIKN